MTEILSYITWNPDAEMFRIGGFAVRWYSMCWLVGLLLAYFLMKKLYKEQKVKDGIFDPLFIYCFLGILIGARLGHCIFYEPEYWLSSPQHVFQIFNGTVEGLRTNAALVPNHVLDAFHLLGERDLEQLVDGDAEIPCQLRQQRDIGIACAGFPLADRLRAYAEVVRQGFLFDMFFLS